MHRQGTASMSMTRHLFLAAIATAGLAMPAAAQQGPIAIPCSGNVTVMPQLVRTQVASDGSSAWSVQVQNQRNYGIAVVVTATGFPATLRVPQPERRMTVGGNSTSRIMMIDAAPGVSAMPAGIAFVLDNPGGGGPTIRVSQCSRWPAATGG